MEGFLAKWAYTTLVDPLTTLAYMYYLGYEGPPNRVLVTSKARRLDRKADHPTRSTLQVRSHIQK